jgi:hypothetical protein
MRRAFRRRPRAVAVTTRPPRAGVPAAAVAVAVAVAAARVAVLFELFGHPVRRGLGMEAAALAAVVAMRRLEVAARGGGSAGRPFDLPRKKGLTYKDLNHDLKPRIQGDAHIAVATHLHGLQHLAQLAGRVLQLVEERHVRGRAPGLGDAPAWCEGVRRDGRVRDGAKRGKR